MAGKTLIGGTAYKISGGKCLNGGTAYKISKGKTLIGGTAYNITFGYLPDEYQQVEYLRVTAAGAFVNDISVKIAPLSDFRFKFRPTPQSSSSYTSYKYIMSHYLADDKEGLQITNEAHYTSGSGYRSTLVVKVNRTSKTIYPEGGYVASADAILAHKVRVYSVSGGTTIYVDGVSKATADRIISPSTGISYITFLGDVKSTGAYSARGDIYYFYYNYNNSSQEYFLYPCYRKSDSQPGFYDVVNSAFYTIKASTVTIGPVYEGEIDIS